MIPQPLYHDNCVVFWPIGIPKITQLPFNQYLAVPREVKGVLKGDDGGGSTGIRGGNCGGIEGESRRVSAGNREECRRGTEESVGGEPKGNKG